jgi:hypothetical protein
MILNKIKTNLTYLADANYWTSLYENDDEEELTEERPNIPQESIEAVQQPTSNKWKQIVERRHQQKQHNIIFDSGATSHFMSEELNLPKTETAQITVYLPDDSTLQATSKTQLPFKQLSPEAREANILPRLTKSLLSVIKMSENGYTTIFRPGNEGVTIHEKGTLTMTLSVPPVLQGCKKKGENLWTVSATATDNECKRIANLYDLPSVNQTIKYLHAAAGYPVKDTWVKAINAENYATWPGLTATAVRKHFPESDETQKGHMKRQQQGLRSTRKLQIIMGDDEDHTIPNPDESTAPKPRKMRDMYIKIHNASETMHTNQPG